MSGARRGEVHGLPDGHKVVVVSADAVTATGWSWCAPIVRRLAVPDTLAIWAVETHETDPVSGVVLVLETAPIPAKILAQPIGTLVGATMARIDDGLRTLFDLP